MISIPAQTRGRADHGWLKSQHTFSFADYYDPKRMGFGALRVINDDAVAPGMGFGTHPHRDMEIISLPLSGSLKHQDSQGNKTVIKKGEVQIMSAGTGIAHSEYNGSDNDEVRFLQIWVMPKRTGLPPRYDQKTYELRPNVFTEVVAPDGGPSAVSINQDAWFSLGKFSSGGEVTYERKRDGNGVFVFLLSGKALVSGERLGPRDAVGITETGSVSLQFTADAEVLVMDVPMQWAQS